MLSEGCIEELTANQQTNLGMIFVPALTSILTHDVPQPHNRLRVSYTVVAFVAMAIIFVQGTGSHIRPIIANATQPS